MSFEVPNEEIMQLHLLRQVQRLKHGGMTFFTFMARVDKIVEEQIFYGEIKRADKQKHLEELARIYQMGDLK